MGTRDGGRKAEQGSGFEKGIERGVENMREKGVEI